jgi:hypothetical protein
MGSNLMLVLTGLLIGCGAGAYAVRSATAQSFPPNPTAPRWEQTCETSLPSEGIGAFVSKAGTEGWELVAVSAQRDTNAMVACFKRPAPGGR